MKVPLVLWALIAKDGFVVSASDDKAGVMAMKEHEGEEGDRVFEYVLKEAVE